MKLERLRPGVLRVTAHTAELATLTAAARWIAEGRPADRAPEELPEEALSQLRRVLERYDRALVCMSEESLAEASSEA